MQRDPAGLRACRPERHLRVRNNYAEVQTHKSTHLSAYSVDNIERQLDAA